MGGHGVVSGVGAIGNRAVYAAAPAVHTVATPAVYSGVHSGVYSGIHSGVYSGLSSVYGNHYGQYYGKREAEAEPEAEAEADPLVYTTGVHGVHASTFAHGTIVSPVVRTVAAPVVHSVAAPVVRAHVSTPAVY